MSADIAGIRQFNPTITRRLGVLNENHLRPYPPLADSRIVCGKPCVAWPQSRRRSSVSGALRNQNTILIATTGVTVAVTLRPAAAVLTPAIRPIRGLQLYSSAGAR
jgi:hypothetical protein